MNIWLLLALAAAGMNIGLLAVLGSVWLRSYRRHRASHTLGLLAFATILLVKNGLWIYFYRFHSEFIGWFHNTSTDVQIGLVLLCGLETVALAVLFRITWQ